MHAFPPGRVRRGHFDMEWLPYLLRRAMPGLGERVAGAGQHKELSGDQGVQLHAGKTSTSHLQRDVNSRGVTS